MPEYWHSIRDNIPEPGDDPETIKQKEFNLRISANKKPYFMVHVYPELKKKYTDYIQDKTRKCRQKFGKYGIDGIEDLIAYENKTPEMEDFIKYYYKRVPVGCNPCVVNRISWLFEKEFDSFAKYNKDFKFDYSIYKSGIDYSARDRDAVYREYLSYDKDLKRLRKRFRAENMDQASCQIAKDALISNYRERFINICTNEFELCDIMLDTIYQKESAKEFVWGICGNTIIKNLLEKNNNTIHYPERVESDGEFEFGGEQFVIKDKVIDIDEYCSFE